MASAGGSSADGSGPLILSRNELLALLRRVFEALYGKTCDYEAMAEQILWLECHGLGGLDLLHDCLARLDGEERHADRHLLGAFLTKGPTIRFDAGGASLIGFGDLLADVLIARCAGGEIRQAEIADLRDARAILPQLHRMALAGRFAAVRISGRGNGADRFARVSASSPLPDLSGWEGAVDCAEQASLHLVCAGSEEGLRSAMRDLHPDWPEPAVTADQLAGTYRGSLNNGVKVRDLAALHAIADRVLVEATEESRRGAGE
ncbi:hypothetical protein A6F65_00108 [Paraurantiacibacter namhicola]|uniref:DUF3726 domain-containing protein n=2 Tax=Paraurantiacibacter namhicola TaxID=645517 RepID=A0A1C7D4N5_9SPHN|nr:hypothetical protein A6F65_00108 [Paraurantiacibacter namhicola]